MRCLTVWLMLMTGLFFGVEAQNLTNTASFSLPAGVIVNKDSEIISTPAWDAVSRLNGELEAARTATNHDKLRIESLRAQESEAHTRAMEEIETLNAAIYGSRHAELMRLGKAYSVVGAELKFTLVNYPRVDGSTSTHPLGCLLACRLLGSDYEWVSDKTRYGADALFIWPGDNEEHRLAEYRLAAKIRADNRLGAIINQVVAIHSGTYQAYEKLIRRESDLILVARPPSSDELALAGSNSVTLKVETVALDAFVFIVNRQNNIYDLTTTQLKAIYSGAVTNWSQVGGRPAHISAYQRERNSGSQELMIDLFMRETPIQAGKAAGVENLVRFLMGGPYLALTRDCDGIAYSVYYYEHFMAGSPMTRPIAVDGVLPTSETIRARQYPYVSPVVAVIRADEPANSEARRLWRWLFTEQGQSLIAESGYVPVSPRKVD